VVKIQNKKGVVCFIEEVSWKNVPPPGGGTVFLLLKADD